MSIGNWMITNNQEQRNKAAQPCNIFSEHLRIKNWLVPASFHSSQHLCATENPRWDMWCLLLTNFQLNFRMVTAAEGSRTDETANMLKDWNRKPSEFSMGWNTIGPLKMNILWRPFVRLFARDVNIHVGPNPHRCWQNPHFRSLNQGPFMFRPMSRIYVLFYVRFWYKHSMVFTRHHHHSF